MKTPFARRPQVVIGFLGTKLDAGVSEKRWDRWRPTVALVGHDKFPVDRIEMLIGSPDHHAMAERVTQDVHSVQPQVEVRTHLVPDMADPWNFQQVFAALHTFARTYAFDESCDYFVHLTTGTHVAQICLFLLTEARYFPAKLVETFSHNAKVTWKGSLEVIDLNVSTYDLLAQRFRLESLEGQDALKGGIQTRNPRFNEVIGRIEKVALRSTAPMLLMGPTGAGKSQLARRIYDLRSRRHLVEGAFVEVNCATLRGDNAMSALFGHKKGAFTGAAADRAGLLKAADRGVLLLDEIGTLGLDEQAMLLCALEDKRFKPMGSDQDTTSEFQLLAGTNQNLNQSVIEGRFRADLLARLNVWSFTLPGLAQRPEDIEPNLDFELSRASERIGARVTMNAAARAAFLTFAATHHWPGNFRDLSACVLRMATLAEGGRITTDDVAIEVAPLTEALVEAPSPVSEHRLCQTILGDSLSSHDRFDLAQLEVVLRAVAETDTMAQAGRQLFNVSRAAKDNPNDSDRVRKFLTRWSLNFTDVRRALAVRA